jgi:hypothetical protein
MTSRTQETARERNAQKDQFDWPLAFEAENLIRKRIETFFDHNSFARHLAERMRRETGTDFFEWVDHLVLPAEEESALARVGLTREKVETGNEEMVFDHARATLPRILLEKGLQQSPGRIALRAESIADFVAAQGINKRIEGGPFSRYRRVVVHEENGTVLEAVERNAYRGFVPAPLHPADLKNIIQAKESFRTRPRRGCSEAEAFTLAGEQLDSLIKVLGTDLTCQVFFEEERRYWESRNRAAQIQKRRQDRLGLGWGNHDHHTYRSSREHFLDVIEFLLRLDFQKRERYYAGAEAGWGAQISEQRNVGIVVFADVDLMPDEVAVDFSTQRLPPASKLGTVGLWVALHGESFLRAGMHHLEARFDFEALCKQLHEEGVETMKPFSNFEFLRQAFTEGERWAVERERLKNIVDRKLITPRQAEKFEKEGALGSHLENLQRRGGFKGFNQKSVSAIITATDPRKNLERLNKAGV